MKLLALPRALQGPSIKRACRCASVPALSWALSSMKREAEEDWGALSREPDGIASSFFHREFYFWGAAKELSGINQVYAVGLAAKHSLMCSVAKTKAPREARGAFHL